MWLTSTENFFIAPAIVSTGRGVGNALAPVSACVLNCTLKRRQESTQTTKLKYTALFILSYTYVMKKKEKESKLSKLHRARHRTITEAVSEQYLPLFDHSNAMVYSSIHIFDLVCGEM